MQLYISFEVTLDAATLSITVKLVLRTSPTEFLLLDLEVYTPDNKYSSFVKDTQNSEELLKHSSFRKSPNHHTLG